MRSTSPLHPESALNPATAQQPAIRIFKRLMRSYAGSAALRLWDGTLYAPAGEAPTFTLVVRDPAVLRRLVFERKPLLLADAYFRGALDVEGDLYRAISLKTHFERLSFTWRDKLALLRGAWRLPAMADAKLEQRTRLSPGSRGASRTAIPETATAPRSRFTTTSPTSSIACGLMRNVSTPAPISRAPTNRWIRRSATSRNTSAASFGRSRASGCSTSAAAGGALEFEAGSTGIYQILASRRNRGEWPVPLSRRDLYAGRDNGQFAGVN